MLTALKITAKFVAFTAVLFVAWALLASMLYAAPWTTLSLSGSCVAYWLTFHSDSDEE